MVPMHAKTKIRTNDFLPALAAVLVNSLLLAPLRSLDRPNWSI